MKLIPIDSWIIRVLLQISPFSNLTQDSLESYIEKYDFRAFSAKKGEVIISQGDMCQKLHVLIDGRLRVETVDLSGNSILLGYKKVPDVFATCPLVSEDGRSQASFTVVKESVIVSVDKNSMMNIVKSNVDLIYPFMCMTHRCNKCLEDRLTVLSMRTIREKVAAYLLQREIEPGKSKIIHSQTQLADYIGVSRPALSTEINKLEKDGLILRERGGVVNFKDEIREMVHPS